MEHWLNVSEEPWRPAAVFAKLRSAQRLAVAFQRIMTRGADISTLYREFTQALMDVLAEQAIGPASRGQLARARATVKKHPEYGEHGYFLAVGARV